MIKYLKAETTTRMLSALRSLPLWALFALALLQTAHGVSVVCMQAIGFLLNAAPTPSGAQLYFYLDSDAKKCFLEELPNDTVVVGHYMAEVWDKASEKFIIKDDLGIAIQVKVSFVLFAARPRCVRESALRSGPSAPAQYRETMMSY